MEFFIQSLDKNIWNVISNNTYVHMPEINESSIEHLDCMAQHIIVSTLAVSYTHLTLPTNREV